MTFSVAFTLCDAIQRMTLATEIACKNFHKLAPTREKQPKKGKWKSDGSNENGEEKPIVVANFRIVNNVHKIINIENKMPNDAISGILNFIVYLTKVIHTFVSFALSALAHTERSTLVVVHTTPRGTERQRERQWEKQKADERLWKVYHFTRKVFQLPFMRKRREEGSGKTIACYGDAKWHKPRKTLNSNSKSSCAAACTFSNENEKRGKNETKTNKDQNTRTKLMLILYLITLSLSLKAKSRVCVCVCVFTT